MDVTRDKVVLDDPRLLYKDADWNYKTIDRVYKEIEKIALQELGLSVYPNQIEIITSEQMLDAYASVGMPLYYKHWSFGKHFARDESLYRKGHRGLAYEIVINSSPCISYIMEENTMTMQALVIAHAAFGHNHFFKNNYLFQQWTDAKGILGYLDFAKEYIAKCEERYGSQLVERTLDAAHALQNQGVNRYQKQRVDLERDLKREEERRQHAQETYDVLWSTIPDSGRSKKKTKSDRRREILRLPEENILYFIEKHSPRLAGWQREIVRIVRNMAQYFMPQRQTKVMNEGCATYVHYEIMTRLHDRGMISDGHFMEFLHSHTSVVFQPSWNDPRYSGINPYALGFSMMKDIERICNDPTDEDREWFPDFAGNGDHMAVLRSAWANCRDESFILQYLSPHLIRELRLFELRDPGEDEDYVVTSISDERGYRKIRADLARSYDPSYLDPNIQVTDVDLDGDRELALEHEPPHERYLLEDEAEKVMQHLAELWGYDVVLHEYSLSSRDQSRTHNNTYRASPRGDLFAEDTIHGG